MESNDKKKKYSNLEIGIGVAIGLILGRFVIDPLYDFIVHTFFK